jgi:hypothetical protein
MPIPDLSNKPGPGRPGYPTGAFEFKLEIQGPAILSFNASKSGGGTNFSIDWGDNTTASGLTGTSHYHTYAAGTFTLAINSKDDTGPIDTFQITGTQTNKNAVKKILNWGTTPWVNLSSAFENCHGLTSVDKSDFYSGSAINLTSAFQNCDNLATVDFTGWKASGNVTGANMFRDCTALESFKLKGSINFANASSNNYWFRDSGASTGCLFDISDLDFTTSTGNQGSVQGWFFDTQIKNGSKFDNWTFPAASWALNQFFYDAHVPDNDATISMQNWTLPNNASTAVNQLFRNLQTDTGSGTNLTLNMSNWNFGNITGLVSFMQNARMSSVVGLSTWTANNLQNINNFFATTVSLGIDANDNFTTSFWNNSNISNCNFAFQSLGGNTTSTTAGAFPALNGMTVASGANFQQIFENTHFNSDASFTGVTFPSTTINFSLAFYTAEFFNSNSTIDFSNSNLKSFTYNTTFRRCSVDNIVFGSNVDFSAVTSWLRMFKADTGDTSYPDQNVTFPTNISFAAATDTREFPNIPFTTCQADNLIRALYATKPTASSNATTFDLTTSAITAAPSVVNGLKDKLVSPGGWNITVNSTDAALPFAYPAYFIDRDVYSSMTPITFPAGSTFTSSNASMPIVESTGVISWASNFSGESIIRCTYPDGCYNEVNMLVGVPMKMTFRMPVGSLSANVGYTNAVRTNEFAIDWGDGNLGDQNNNSHTYASDGDYTVSVFKNYDPSMGSRSYLLSVDQWGEYNHYLGGYAFRNSLNFDVLATDSCILHGTSLANCFEGCDSLTNANNSIGNWDVSGITNMSSLFRACDVFNADISQWVTTNVTNMSSMFAGTHYRGPYPAFNQDINTKLRSDGTLAWDTRNVETMAGMWLYNYAFEYNIGNWNTDRLENMSGFRYLYVSGKSWPNNDMSTKQVTLGTHTYIAWDVASVTNFGAAFGASTSRGANANGISNWNTSSATNMGSMFGGSSTDDSSWDLSTRTVTVGTGATARTYTAWDTSNVQYMNRMFYGFGTQDNAYIQGISNWNTQTVTTVSEMFRAFRTADVNLNNWNTSSLQDANRMVFGNPYNPPAMDQSFSNWDMTSFTGTFGNWQEYYSRPDWDGEISTANYNATLIGWGAQAANVNSGVILQMGKSKYTGGGAAEAGRTALINAGWIINDGGAVYSNTNALSFNGSTEYIDTFYVPDSSLANAFSISAYVKSSSIGISPGNTIIGTYDFTNNSATGGQNRARFYINILVNSGAYELLVGFGTFQNAYELGNFNASQWNHIAVTYDGSNLKLYCNGGSPAHTISLSSPGLLPPMGSYDGHLYIGATNRLEQNLVQNPGQYWNGDIDEVMLWNTELTQGEVQAYANTIGSGSIPDPNAITGLQLWNRMGD